MQHSPKLLLISVLGWPVAALVALGSSSAQAASWSGWARCQITTRGTGYEQTDTHTWFINNVAGNTQGTRGSGSWQAVGKGKINQGNPASSLMSGEWALNGMAPAPNAQFTSTVNAGVVTIVQSHAQLRTSNGLIGYLQQTRNNTPQKPTAVSGTVWEWQFPRIQGSATGQTIVGTSQNTYLMGWGYMQVSGSTVASACQWSLADGNTPSPPPLVPAEPPPGIPGSSPPSDRCAGLRNTPTLPPERGGSVKRIPRPTKEGESIVVCP